MNEQQIQQFEHQAAQLANARAELSQRAEALNKDIRALKRRRITGLKNAAERAIQCQNKLLEMIRDNKELFEKPKTQVFHGIRIGFMKQRGKLEFDDEAEVVARIKKLLPDEKATLITVKEKPVKSALANLAASTLKRLGIRVHEDSDEAIVKSTDTEVDRLVDALLEGEEELE